MPAAQAQHQQFRKAEHLWAAQAHAGEQDGRPFTICKRRASGVLHLLCLICSLGVTVSAAEEGPSAQPAGTAVVYTRSTGRPVSRPWGIVVNPHTGAISASGSQVNRFAERQDIDTAGQHQSTASIDPPQPQHQEQAKAEALVQCINAAYTPTYHDWNASFTHLVPALRVIGVWRSPLPRTLPVSLVTQASLNRLHQLRAQCSTWAGPLSVALHVGILQPNGAGPLTPQAVATLNAAINTVARFAADVAAHPSPGGCQLDVLLVYEVYLTPRTRLLYPYNALRNLARLAAATPLIAIFDADLVVARALSDSLAKPEQAANYVALTLGDGGGGSYHSAFAGNPAASDNKRSSRKSAIVVPTFETNSTLRLAIGVALADNLAAANKSVLMEYVTSRHVSPFDKWRYRAGHHSTQFDYWYRYSDLLPYSIQTAHGYEPYVIVHRTAAPWHDVRYRGYGWDKIIQIQMMAAQNYSFVVHPSAYLVHRPHVQSEVSTNFWVYSDGQLKSNMTIANYTATLSGRALDGAVIKEFNSEMNKIARRDLRKGTFTISLDAATLACRDVLMWWRLDAN